MNLDAAESFTERTLSELVLARPQLAQVFDRLGIDFCCHGDRSLSDACNQAGVPLEEAIQTIEVAGQAQLTVDGSWKDLDPPALADHIETVHHHWLREEMPELQRLAAKVESVHGDRHAELAEVRQLVGELWAEFEPHLTKEEKVLFPAIRSLTQGEGGFFFGSISNPITQMMSEHETVGELFESLRSITADYAVPEDGCASYRMLYERLAALESDIHLHVFKENSVLFPAAISVESALFPHGATKGTALSSDSGPTGPIPILPRRK